MRQLLFVSLIGLLLVASASALEECKLFASDPQFESFFGYQVALDRNRLVVTAPYAGYEEGAAYVFRRNWTTWVQEAKLVSPEPFHSELFGEGADIRGDLIAIGGIGTATVFRLVNGSWTVDARFTGLGESGEAIIFTRNGLLIGAYDLNRVFYYEYIGTQWQLVQELTGEPGSNSRFGVRLAQNGDRIAVAASFGTQGSVYLFQYDGSSWVQTARIPDPAPTFENFFGASIALQGNRLFIADTSSNQYRGQVYSYVHRPSGWQPDTILTGDDPDQHERFGCAMAVSGRYLLIGAEGHSVEGAAYLFRRTGSQWTMINKIVPENSQADDSFGCSVTLKGARFAVGAVGVDEAGWETGAAYVFRGVHDSLTDQPPPVR